MELSVISFNIRYCSDPNGNSIAERAPRLNKIMSFYDADVIGFQEYTPEWEEYIEKYFCSDYEVFNKYRAEKSLESTPILWKINYNRKRLIIAVFINFSDNTFIQ